MTKIVPKIQKVTCPQTFENKGNTHNIIKIRGKASFSFFGSPLLSGVLFLKNSTF